VDSGKLALLERFGAEMRSTARRYSPSAHDAEDAYQRAVEILLTHDPRGTGDEVCRWLRTVVKHEALAIRRQRQRVLPAGEPARIPEPPGAQPDTHERAEQLERLQHGAQAIGRLKPQEVRCLLLRAEGYSYREICAETGWTYTKVNRCLAEGRRAFLERIAGIESGAECERLAPYLSALADGEATADDLTTLRAHLKTCLSCRARLREYRAVPSRVAALVPPVAIAAQGRGGGQLRSALESLVGAVQDRVAALGERTHQATEMATGGKLAAVAASAAALAGGGAATVEHLGDRGAGTTGAASVRPAKEELAPPAPGPSPRAPADSAPPSRPAPGPAPAPAPKPKPTPSRPPSPANEFAPEAATAGAPTAPPAPAPASRSSEFDPGPARSSGGGEFSP
jgi:RNA polymerase sigma factor (sigma-70 family)